MTFDLRMMLVSTVLMLSGMSAAYANDFNEMTPPLLHGACDKRYNLWHSCATNDPNCLVGFDFSKHNLSMGCFRKQNLSGANFRETILSASDFKYADLSNANFTGATLIGSNLSHTIMKGADFSNADLRSTRVNNTCWETAKYNKHTQFPAGFVPQQHGMVYIP